MWCEIFKSFFCRCYFRLKANPKLIIWERCAEYFERGLKDVKECCLNIVNIECKMLRFQFAYHKIIIFLESPSITGNILHQQPSKTSQTPSNKGKNTKLASSSQTAIKNLSMQRNSAEIWEMKIPRWNHQRSVPFV